MMLEHETSIDFISRKPCSSQKVPSSSLCDNIVNECLQRVAEAVKQEDTRGFRLG